VGSTATGTHLACHQKLRPRLLMPSIVR
jgi:hypothetical protein